MILLSCNYFSSILIFFYYFIIYIIFHQYFIQYFIQYSSISYQYLSAFQYFISIYIICQVFYRKVKYSRQLINLLLVSDTF